MNRLITIPISHYCEKARWALEIAKIQYVEEAHLQGFHFRHVLKAGGSDSAPVLVTPEGPLNDSTKILKWVDSKLEDGHKFYPSEGRQEIEEIEEYLDEGFGVAGRLWMYTFMLDRLPVFLRYSKLHRIPRLEI